MAVNSQFALSLTAKVGETVTGSVAGSFAAGATPFVLWSDELFLPEEFGLTILSTGSQLAFRFRPTVAFVATFEVWSQIRENISQPRGVKYGTVTLEGKAADVIPPVMLEGKAADVIPPVITWPHVIIGNGAGNFTVRLYDLFKANGKPERIGYAIEGGTVDAGVLWTTTTALPFAVGAGMRLREEGGRLYGWWGGAASAGPLDPAIQAVAVVENVTSAGVTWWTASRWSRAGEWVRRKSWLDIDKCLCHDAGPGTARAVAVIVSEGAPVARAVKATDFGEADFLAADWVLKFPPAGTEIDLTDAVISVDAAKWTLWKQGQAGTIDPNDPFDPNTGGGCVGCP